MILFLSLLGAFVAGFVHALEPDHVAAVTTFVSRREPASSGQRALGFGIYWGVGHAFAVLALGAALLLLDLDFPEAAVSAMEFFVGAMLLALGLQVLWNLLHGAAHTRAPGTHVASAHNQPHGTLWVGLVHGVAGTAPLVAVLPVTLIASAPLALFYLLLFGVGTVAGMAVYATIAGVAFCRVRTPRVAGALRASSGLGSAALGVLWIVIALG